METPFQFPCLLRSKDAIVTLDGGCQGKHSVFRCYSIDIATEKNVPEAKAMIRRCVKLIGKEETEGVTYCEYCNYRVKPEGEKEWMPKQANIIDRKVDRVKAESKAKKVAKKPPRVLKGTVTRRPLPVKSPDSDRLLQSPASDETGYSAGTISSQDELQS